MQLCEFTINTVRWKGCQRDISMGDIFREKWPGSEPQKLKMSGRSASQHGGQRVAHFVLSWDYLAMDSRIAETDAKSTGAIVTVRLIRSFEYRNIKYVVFKDVPLEQTVEHFMNFVISGEMFYLQSCWIAGWIRVSCIETLMIMISFTEIKKRPDVPPPFRNFTYGLWMVMHRVILFSSVPCSLHWGPLNLTPSEK